MGKYEEKYGVKENAQIGAFHKKRRMFCIKGGKLFLAAPNLGCSHADWFEQEGWMDEAPGRFMEETVRGAVDEKGDVYFYAGYYFRVDAKIESIFLSHLGELAQKLHLKPNGNVFGGLIKQKSAGKWLPQKTYGTIKENLGNKD
jgi:hypothetical protein